MREAHYVCWYNLHVWSLFCHIVLWYFLLNKEIKLFTVWSFLLPPPLLKTHTKVLGSKMIQCLRFSLKSLKHKKWRGRGDEWGQITWAAGEAGYWGSLQFLLSCVFGNFLFSDMVCFLNSCKRNNFIFLVFYKVCMFFIYFYNKPSSSFMNIDLK